MYKYYLHVHCTCMLSGSILADIYAHSIMLQLTVSAQQLYTFKITFVTLIKECASTLL